MFTATKFVPAGQSATAHHAEFCARILPAVERHGRVYFRHVKCSVKREDAIAEMVALSWKWYLRLVARGKDATRFPTALATFAARAVCCGRRVCGQEPGKDALSPLAQRRHGFAVEKLPDYSTLSGNVLDEALHDNTRTPPPDQAAFRMDFPAWRLTRTERDRRIVDDLMAGERTLAVAARYGLCAARVSQLRREFHDDWHLFQGEGA
jgi:hypothetical protein